LLAFLALSSASARWMASAARTALVELLQGKLSKNVMERVCREVDGLFPAPREITMSCSCPDWAGLCKHVAATLYGVGARLDHHPDLLFTLRRVNRDDMVSAVGGDLSLTSAAVASERVLADDDVAALFDLDVSEPMAIWDEARHCHSRHCQGRPTPRKFERPIGHRRHSRASENQDRSEAEDTDGRTGERACNGSEAAPDSAPRRAEQCSKGRRGPFPTWARSATPAKPNLKPPRHTLTLRCAGRGRAIAETH
jgi:hypothetical protein